MRSIFCLLILFVTCQCRILTKEEREEAVRSHNLVRRAVVPPASNMNELEYSEELELIASNHLDKCHFAHLYHEKGYGENGRLASDSNITRSVMNWFQERVYYDWNKPYGERCYLKNEADNYLVTPQCGHYKMITTHTLTQVGCAINYCEKGTSATNEDFSNAYLIFCFYDKGPRDHPYAVGKPCTGCSSFSHRFCRDGLCIDGKKGDCRIVCKRCQAYPTFFTGYCGCDCDAGDGNDCSEEIARKPTPATCKPCLSNGTPCQNGGKDVSTGPDQCKCECLDGYKGQFCEITPEIINDLNNSAVITIFGKPWLYGFNYPVDRFEFLKNWNLKLRKQIANDINQFCKKTGEYCDLEKVSEEEIHLAHGSPENDERGSLIFKVFVKYANTQKYVDRRLVRTLIIQQAIKGEPFSVNADIVQ